MPDPGHGASLEEQIDRWRSYLRRRQAIHSVDVAELEDHLREQVAVLIDAGLATDEAFLVAVKRMGNLDDLSREFARGRWGQVGGRMDFIRFSGELFIYFVLIALGGGVLMASMRIIFQSIGIDVEPFFESWLLPCGAVGAVVVASWLVEAKQSVIENMAPVLTRLFTPLFAAVLVTFLGTLLWTGRAVDIERNALIAFDLLLVVVLGLLLYSVSARDPRSLPGAFDVVQVVLVVSALLADAVALWAIAARITDFGFSPNRVAALGENVILLVNLAWSAVLYIRFLRGRGSFTGLERWQTDYLPVYAVWAAIVVIAFPPVFGYS